MNGMKYIKSDHGYPSKKYIRYLLERYTDTLDHPLDAIQTKRITFSGMYGEEGKRHGILWMDTRSMKGMNGFHIFLAEHGVKVKMVKDWGEVHSIWFDCDI